MLEGYMQRPFEIARIIVKAVNGMPHSGPEGKQKYIGTSLSPLTDDITLVSMDFRK